MQRIEFAELPEDFASADLMSQQSIVCLRLRERMAHIEHLCMAWQKASKLADMLKADYSAARKAVSRFDDPSLDPLKQRMELALEIALRLDSEKSREREAVGEDYDAWWQRVMECEL